MNEDQRLTQEQARRVWRRAAELQALAAERPQEPYESGARDEGDTIPVSEVQAAAVEAGIGGEYVELALAEAEGVLSAARRDRSWVVRAARRFLGNPPAVVVVSRTIAATPETIYESMQRVFPSSAFGLVPLDTRGSDLFKDAELVFDVEQPAFKTRFQWDLDLGDVKQIHTTLRRAGPDGSMCAVTLRAPLTRMGINLLLGSGVTALGGAAWGGAGAAAGGALTGALGLAGATAGAVVGAVFTGGTAFGAGLGMLAYRGIYRWAVGRARSGLERLLGALAVDARTAGAFLPGAAVGAGLQPPASGRSDTRT